MKIQYATDFFLPIIVLKLCQINDDFGLTNQGLINTNLEFLTHHFNIC